MDLENIMLNETSQSVKEKHHMISLMWNLMNKVNKQNRDRLIGGEHLIASVVGG